MGNALVTLAIAFLSGAFAVLLHGLGIHMAFIGGVCFILGVLTSEAFIK